MNSVPLKQRSSLAVLAAIVAMAVLISTAAMAVAASGTTERVSVDSAGQEATGGGSDTPSVSATGRFVAFDSSATNLVPGDTNGVTDVFVRDRDADNDGVFDEAGAVSTERASVDDAGNQASGIGVSSDTPSISADGRFVTFDSNAANLVADDTNGFYDVFVHDRTTHTTRRVSLHSSGDQANRESRWGSSISENGRFVAFPSQASNLVAPPQKEDTNAFWDFFVRDRDADNDGVFDEAGAVSTERASVDDAGNQANAPYGVYVAASISPDGRFVGFTTNAANLVPGDTNGSYDTFVRDLQTDTTERASVDDAGNQANNDSHGPPSISSTGRVAFSSIASNLVPNDTNGSYDTFVRDLQTDTTERASVDDAGNQANNDSHGPPSINGDGRLLAFVSTATNLVAGDTNGARDVFVRDLQTRTTERASVDGAGGQASGVGVISGQPSISGDGRFVGFSSSAANLVAGDTNGVTDVFVRDRQGVSTPETSIDSGPSGSVASASAAFGFSSSQPDATFECSLDGSAFGPCSSPKEYTALADGDHAFEVRATNGAGADPTPAKRTWRVDTVAPTVVGVSPASATTGVPLTVNPEVTFSEGMDGATVVNPSNFALTKQNSTIPLEANVTYNSADKKATLDPNSDLEANTIYTATVKGGSSGMKDPAGNALAQDHTWTFTTAAPPAPKCTKTGTANAETISGTSGDDVICAGGGNDTIKGLGGNDTIRGEAGNDILLGGVGNDTLDGGLGTDTASYSASLTAVIASLATNTATGEGSDTYVGVENLLGSSKADTLTGSGTNNKLTGGGGNDTEHGGLGNDTVIGSGGADTLKGEGGDDTVNSRDGVNGNDTLDGGAGTDKKVTDSTEKSIVGFP